MIAEGIVMTYHAPAASNYGSTTKAGFIVYKSETTGLVDEVTIQTSPSAMPLGIIVDAENASGGWVTVCISGRCYGIAGAAVTNAAAVMADGAGECIVGTAGNMCVGRFIGHVDAADGEYLLIDVSPFELET